MKAFVSFTMYHSHRHNVRAHRRISEHWSHEIRHIMPLITRPCPQLRANMNARKGKKDTPYPGRSRQTTLFHAIRQCKTMLVCHPSKSRT